MVSAIMGMLRASTNQASTGVFLPRTVWMSTTAQEASPKNKNEKIKFARSFGVNVGVNFMGWLRLMFQGYCLGNFSRRRRLARDFGRESTNPRLTSYC